MQDAVQGAVQAAAASAVVKFGKGAVQGCV